MNEHFSFCTWKQLQKAKKLVAFSVSFIKTTESWFSIMHNWTKLTNLCTFVVPKNVTEKR